jgi:hypothetical protein
VRAQHRSSGETTHLINGAVSQEVFQLRNFALFVVHKQTRRGKHHVGHLH